MKYLVWTLVLTVLTIVFAYGSNRIGGQPGQALLFLACASCMTSIFVVGASNLATGRLSKRAATPGRRVRPRKVAS